MNAIVETDRVDVFLGLLYCYAPSLCYVCMLMLEASLS